MPELELFKGNDKRKENPQNWLRKLKGSKFKSDTPDAQRAFVFENHLEYDSDADTWFKSLTQAVKDDWAQLETAFHQRWPPLTKVGPTKDALRAKFHLLLLKAEDIGLTIGEEPDEVYTHVDWVQRAQTLAEKIGDTDGNLIAIAKNNMPTSLNIMLGSSDTSDWTKFTTAICALNINNLLLANRQNLAIDAATATLANMQIQGSSFARPAAYTQTSLYSSPRTTNRTPYARMQSAPEPTTPSPAAPTTAATAPSTPTQRSFAPSTPARTPARNAWPLTPSPTPISSQLVALAQQAVEANPPPDTTEEGRRQYNTACANWINKYGADRRPDFNTDHFPLTPGSSPLGSGECFNCGLTGHMGRDCASTTKIPAQESIWRARVNGAVNPRRARFAESPGTLPVFQIDAEDIEVDPEVYDTSELRFAEDNQGNVPGSRY
ncbi:hypothetical protein FIBSPDRAFT_962943 [Athelia psychrophila]|uniref:CCHC-type domain-containing protein n=1 Tax=Athelia psychrophila TaxID=1759441 RepID=A0A165ZIU2_9AGAM|nr:hypothetical protein FIBSPDRAFT_962943 [Fibularhizoctonia sp. CBS 109695]